METPKVLPKGTTQEQWDRYQEDLKRHEERCEREKPRSEDFHDLNFYYAAKNAWLMMCSMDEPNEPGYYRANND